MKLVCAPVKEWPARLPVDLYEFKEGNVKLLYDRHKKLQFIDRDWKENPSTDHPLIISYHNYTETPDLELTLAEIKQRHPRAWAYKIATWAQSTLDSLRMIHFQRQHPEVIGICMGEKGAITRILAPFTYASLREEDKNAPGQLLWSELEEIYHYSRITFKTRLYGLIGDPVSHSIGHLYHNDAFRYNQMDAVYLKMGVTPAELPSFFEAIKMLPFYGLSVTAPLKEKVIPGAIVNTLYQTEKGWEGCNTDGIAALTVLGCIAGTQIVILGAGGAAKAIKEALIEGGARVILLQRGMKIPTYDILINATSSSSPDFEDRFIAGKQVMDISIRPTPFLRRAKAAGCLTMDGLPLYFYQALLQSIHWMQVKDLDPPNCH